MHADDEGGGILPPDQVPLLFHAPDETVDTHPMMPFILPNINGLLDKLPVKLTFDELT
jgi:hypothetical protein